MTTIGLYPQFPQSQSKPWQVKANQPSEPVISVPQMELSALIRPQMGNACPATLQPARSLLITSTTWTFSHLQMQSLASTTSQPQAPQLTRASTGWMDPAPEKLPSGRSPGPGHPSRSGSSHHQFPKQGCFLQPQFYRIIVQLVLWFSCL